MTTEIPPPPPPSTLRQLLMRVMLVFVAVSVVVAIAAVLRGEPLGETLAKIVNTGVVAGLFAALALSCADAAEKRRTLYAYAGMALALVAVAVFFVGVWFDASRTPWWWKAMAIVSVHSIAMWRGAHLMLSTLTGPASLIVRGTIFACVTIAWTITMMVIHERADPSVLRVMNACWILAIGGHIAVPILEKLDAKKPPAP